MPFHIYAYNGVWLRYMSLPVKWQDQSYCSCLCNRASQMITLLWFCKTMSLPCTSKNTLRIRTFIKQKFDRRLFCIICHGTYPVLWCLSPQVLDQQYFSALKELYKFSLVTMLTLDGFGRLSETISVTPWKLSGIRERIWSWTLPSIMFAAGCFLMSVHWSKP